LGLRNKEKFRKEILGLRRLLSDTSYCSRLEGSYVGFLNDMHMALLSNRRITAKMVQSIQNANRHYDFARDPKNVEKRRNILVKLVRLRSMVKHCQYTSDYRDDRKTLIQSFIDQVRRKGTLTKKQFVYANNLYKQFTKRIAKVKNKP
tara:strand:+ start:156 stop:599 length:444 start_codon:yes stop_codon:yes gene_type:complete